MHLACKSFKKFSCQLLSIDGLFVLFEKFKTCSPGLSFSQCLLFPYHSPLRMRVGRQWSSRNQAASLFWLYIHYLYYFLGSYRHLKLPPPLHLLCFLPISTGSFEVLRLSPKVQRIIPTFPVSLDWTSWTARQRQRCAFSLHVEQLMAYGQLDMISDFRDIQPFLLFPY